MWGGVRVWLSSAPSVWLSTSWARGRIALLRPLDIKCSPETCLGPRNELRRGPCTRPDTVGHSVPDGAAAQACVLGQSQRVRVLGRCPAVQGRSKSPRCGLCVCDSGMRDSPGHSTILTVTVSQRGTGFQESQHRVSETALDTRSPEVTIPAEQSHLHGHRGWGMAAEDHSTRDEPQAEGRTVQQTLVPIIIFTSSEYLHGPSKLLSLTLTTERGRAGVYVTRRWEARGVKTSGRVDLPLVALAVQREASGSDTAPRVYFFFYCLCAWYHVAFASGPKNRSQDQHEGTFLCAFS